MTSMKVFEGPASNYRASTGLLKLSVEYSTLRKTSSIDETNLNLACSSVRCEFLVPVFWGLGTGAFWVVGTGPGRRCRPGFFVYSSGSIG
ncbi:hypothetical protein, partial [Corynebacterium macginleyi]|uniref:hypothetical protein n=1 Tax=Corynebacterium macginleyi TaxID=38290 RepID=UPI001C7DEF47